MLFANPRSCFAFVVIFLMLGVAISYNPANDDLMEEVSSALDNVLGFFSRAHRTINLDGIFGLRVAQGALLSVVNDAKEGQLSIDKDKLAKVEGLYHKASLIAEEALPFLKQSSPDYFKKFKKQISGPWSNFKPFRNLQKRQNDRAAVESRRNAISFDEDTSDQCLSELTGTAVGSDSQPCQISDRCWHLISAEGTEGYTLTHQALFLLVGEIQGCTPKLLERLEQSHIKGGLEEFYGRICSDMYPQMTAIEQKRTLVQSNYQKDLYMEQAMVCGSMGFHEFLTSERLRNILGWQRNDGCFGEKRVSVNYNEEKRDEDDVEQEEKDEAMDETDQDVKESDSPFGNMKRSLGYESFSLRKTLSARTMRALLMEKELKDGCLSHVTGVATGLLGVYVRWLLYPHGQTFKKLSQHHPETEQSLDYVQKEEREVYANDNLADVVQLKQKQQQQQQKEERELYANDNLADVIELKQKKQQHQRNKQVEQSSHLMQMRKAAMLPNDAKEMLLQKAGEGREGAGFVSWKLILLVSVLVVLIITLLKGKLLFNGVIRVIKSKTKNTHII